MEEKKSPIILNDYYYNSIVSRHWKCVDFSPNKEVSNEKSFTNPILSMSHNVCMCI